MNWGVEEPTPPPVACPGCGGEKKCGGCDDVRPTADELHVDWQVRSPLDRWETVTRVEQDGRYDPVRVWTNKTGPNYCWVYRYWQKVDAVPPLQTFHGDPVIRVIEHLGNDGPMYAVATISTHMRPETCDPLVTATFGGTGKGWTVMHRPAGGELTTVNCDSKAAARTALRAAARDHARALRVKLVLPTKENKR